MRNVLMIIALIASGCSVGRGESRDAGSRAFAVTGFDSVALESSDDVHVVRGAASAVVATGSDATLDKLDIRVEGSQLKIGRKRTGWGMSWSSDRGAIVTVTMPGIRSAAVAGSGAMSVDRVEGDAFETSVAGSGSLRLDTIAVARAKFSNSGSGDINVSGTSGDSKFALRGSGEIDAAKLNSRRVDVSVAGSGDVRAAASESATISIAGSGDATVTGTDRCQISKAGSGEGRCSR